MDSSPGAAAVETVGPEAGASPPPLIEDVRAHAITVPTDAPEADGTLSWDSTTVVVVQASSEGHVGTGYSYAAAAAAGVVEEMLAGTVRGQDALSPRGAWQRTRAAVRNIGYPG